jgi:multiple sugar transport system permease protein
VAIQGFISYAGVDWAELAAASVIVILPVLVFTIFTQKGLVRGLTAGAIK